MEGLLDDIGMSGTMFAVILVMACAMAATVARGIENGAVAIPVAAVSGTFFGVLVTLAANTLM